MIGSFAFWVYIQYSLDCKISAKIKATNHSKIHLNKVVVPWH